MSYVHLLMKTLLYKKNSIPRNRVFYIFVFISKRITEKEFYLRWLKNDLVSKFYVIMNMRKVVSK